MIFWYRIFGLKECFKTCILRLVSYLVRLIALGNYTKNMQEDYRMAIKKPIIRKPNIKKAGQVRENVKLPKQDESEVVERKLTVDFNATKSGQELLQLKDTENSLISNGEDFKDVQETKDPTNLSVEKAQEQELPLEQAEEQPQRELQQQEKTKIAKISKTIITKLGKRRLNVLDNIENLVDGFEYVTPNPQRYTSLEGKAITVVNNKNSKRMKFSKDILKKLKNPKFVQCGFRGNAFIVFESEEHVGHCLKGDEEQPSIIYNAELVERLTQLFSLDYTERTSYSVGEVTYTTVNEKLVAIITAEAEDMTDELVAANPSEGGTSNAEAI